MVAHPDHGARQQVQTGDCAALRGASRFVGAVLVLSSVGIWAVPASSGDPGMVLMKLLVSVCLACVGAMLVEAGRKVPLDEVHLDTERRELRHVTRSCRGQEVVLARHDFADLADIRLQNGLMTVIALDGRVLMQLPMADIDNLPAMRQALGLSLAKAV